MKNMEREALINKVNKLLALAGNNPSQGEAKAAMAKAQKLIAQYNLNQSELSQEEREAIVLLPAKHTRNKGFRTTLAAIIARNFRCRAMMVGPIVHFMGYETDAKVCVEVFNFAYAVCRKNGNDLAHQTKLAGRDHTGIAQGYFRGFIEGIRQVLDEQCRALMIIVPDEVNSEADKTSGGTYRGGMKRQAVSSRAFQQGVEDGRNHMRSRQLEAH